MGVDIAVNICAQMFTPAAIWDCIEINFGSVYLISGSPGALSGNRPYFSLWSTESISLVDVCKRLSLKVERVYSCWKSDHGGVAGYRIYDKGLESAALEGSIEQSMLLDGYHECFGEKLPISADKALLFPEALIADPLECWLLDSQSGKCLQQSKSIITQLLNGDIQAEPVLPFDL
jgi:hypothetical protein